MCRIGDAAAFAGTTPRAIRHYHAIGLLAEPERGSDDRRRYGYDDMVRLLWIRRMADAGVSLTGAGVGSAGGDAGRLAAAAAAAAREPRSFSASAQRSPAGQ